MITHLIKLALIHLTLFILCVQWVQAIPTPTTSGPVSNFDKPLLRIPMLKKAPKIDGFLEEGEWEDASALTGFWSQNVKAVPYPKSEHLGPHEIQSKVFAAYDKEHLYIVYRVRMYPQESWLKAKGRFPDVYNHPLYGIMQDDHIEFELRPYHDLAKGYKKGMFKWFVNPISVVSDQYWSLDHGLGKRWQAKANIRCAVEKEWWNVEMQIPLKELVVHHYAKKEADGRPSVILPPPDGTSYRVWFKNGIGGGGTPPSYTVSYDQHVWNVCKTQLVLDSQCVSFQIEELGRVMEDSIDVKVHLKNHDAKSQSVRLGFFVENAENNIFSSYETDTAKDGLVELLPGERKTIRFKKRFPGITGDDNFLWFDVRSAGYPAKTLYQCRLTKFHSTTPPPPYQHWVRDKLDIINGFRPARVDFDFKYQYSPYTNKLSAVVDKGNHGASDEAKSAVQAKLTVLDELEEEIAEKEVEFRGDFATMLLDMPELKKGHYQVSLLLFDEDTRIVGEREMRPFYKGEFAFEKNQLGKEDIVWSPFTPIEVEENKLDTLKHGLTLSASGLPEQIHIKPDIREIPLESRDKPQSLSMSELQSMGRGDQLRSPMRFSCLADGKEFDQEIVESFKPVKEWKSEYAVRSKLKSGPIDISLDTRYDCDGSMYVQMTYGSKQKVQVDQLELVMDLEGDVDTCAAGEWDMQPVSGMEMSLPTREGVIWDSASHLDFEDIELYYSRFVPQMYFGNGDRGWTWIADSDQHWLIDRSGSTMTLERNKQGQVSWRIKFINHKTDVEGYRTLSFQILTHPAKNKQSDYRKTMWLSWNPQNYAGDGLECLPNDAPFGIDGSDETFKFFKKRYPHGAPRLYIVKNWINSGTPPLAKGAYTGEWLLNSSAKLDQHSLDKKGMYGQPWNRPGKSQIFMEWNSQSWADYFVYHCERMIRLGQVPGWWWDELFTPNRGNCVANGSAYFRDPSEVKDKELPYQSNFATIIARDMFKRISRLQTKNQIPVLSSFWANASAQTFEAFGTDFEMPEGACGISVSYEIDNIVKFPLSFFRFCAGTTRGMYGRVAPLHVGRKGFALLPGDEVRYDRGVIGRALIHDVGCDYAIANHSELASAMNALDAFGYFKDEHTQMIPYWRSQDLIRYGEALEEEGFETREKNPDEHVKVTVYRRAYKKFKGKTGYKALIIVHNEGPTDVRSRLHILDEKKIFGGPNNMVMRMAHGDIQVPHGVHSTTHFRRGHQYSRYFGLKDVERKEGVIRSMKDRAALIPLETQIYGPLHVPSHDFRIIYGHYDPEMDGMTPAAIAGKYIKSLPDPRLKHYHQVLREQKKAWWKVWKEMPQLMKKNKQYGNLEKTKSAKTI